MAKCTPTVSLMFMPPKSRASGRGEGKRATLAMCGMAHCRIARFQVPAHAALHQSLCCHSRASVHSNVRLRFSVVGAPFLLIITESYFPAHFFAITCFMGKLGRSLFGSLLCYCKCHLLKRGTVSVCFNVTCTCSLGVVFRNVTAASVADGTLIRTISASGFAGQGRSKSYLSNRSSH